MFPLKSLKSPVRVLSWLVLMSTGFFCQHIEDKIFVISNAWRGYCPDVAVASLTVPVKSIKECALQCSSTPQCVLFGFYSSSATCCMYSFVPQKVNYDEDCTFMMDRKVLFGSTEMSLINDSCNITQAEDRNSLKLTLAKKAICFSLPGFPIQPSTVLDLGNGPIPLPSVNNWIIIMQRFDGSLDFHRYWIDYKNGFGDIGRGEFWLGNEIVHRLTNTKGLEYILRVEVRLNKTGEWFNTDYATFSLDSESNYYAIHVSGFCGSAGDSFTNSTWVFRWYLNGANFTTRDADNDLKDGNCAQTYRAGWWYKDCANCCFTCQFGSKSFIWMSLQGTGPNASDGILREARMMIKSK